MIFRKRYASLVVLGLLIIAALVGYSYLHRDRFGAGTDLHIKNFVAKGPSWYSSGHKVEAAKSDQQ